MLLAVAGYNLARFQLARPGRTARVRGHPAHRARRWRCRPRLWIGVVALVDRRLPLATALFLNGATGSRPLERRLAVLVPRGARSGATSAWPRWSRVPLGRPLAAPRPVRASQRWSLAGVPRAALRPGRASRPVRSSATGCWRCSGAWRSGWAAATADTLRRRLLVAAARSWRRSASSVTPSARPSWSLGILVLLAGPRRPGAATAGRASCRRSRRPRCGSTSPSGRSTRGSRTAGHPYAAVLAALAVGIVGHGAYGRVLLAGRWVICRPRPRQSPTASRPRMTRAGSGTPTTVGSLPS